MIDLALIGRDEETKWIPGQSRMWLDDTCPHEASGRSGLRQLYDKMALAGRVRGNEIGRAHGTPVTNAHLVCRLLLEKKNNNTIYHHKPTQTILHITIKDITLHQHSNQQIIQNTHNAVHNN